MFLFSFQKFKGEKITKKKGFSDYKFILKSFGEKFTCSLACNNFYTIHR